MLISTGPFPTVYWQPWDADATFDPGAELPDVARDQFWAVLTFVFYGDRVALAEIEGRGLCIPSGRIEPGETFTAAAAREVYEEIGARLPPERLRLIGWYRMVPRGGPEAGQVRYSAVYVAEALGFESIPEGSESRGLFLAAVEDVADLYFLWDPLMASVFAYAEAQKKALFPVGVPLSALLES